MWTSFSHFDIGDLFTPKNPINRKLIFPDFFGLVPKNDGTRISIIYNMCIQPYTETALRALQLRRRSHPYGLRSRVSQGSPEERRAQVLHVL